MSGLRSEYWLISDNVIFVVVYVNRLFSQNEECNSGFLHLCFDIFFCASTLIKYVKESVSSSGSPLSVTGLLFFVLALLIFVLLMLMLSPICVDTVLRSSVFFLHLLVILGQESEVICW